MSNKILNNYWNKKKEKPIELLNEKIVSNYKKVGERNSYYRKLAEEKKVGSG